MPHTLSSKKIEELRKVFNQWDRDKNGELDIHELRIALKNCGNFSEEEIQEIMRSGDKDGSGTLNFKEFLAME